jgi:hypothetical protein
VAGDDHAGEQIQATALFDRGGAHTLLSDHNRQAGRLRFGRNASGGGASIQPT